MLHRASPAVLAVLLTLAPAATAAQVAPAEPGAITGRLIDQQTGEPVADATVNIQDRRIGAVTDADGRFRIAPLPAGRYTLVVTHVAYDENEATVRVRPGATTHLDAALTQRAIVLREIRVTDESRLARERRMRGTPVRVLDRRAIDSLSIGAGNLGDLIGRLPGTTYHGATGAPCIEAVNRIKTKPAPSGAPEGSRVTGGCMGALIVVDGIVLDMEVRDELGRARLVELNPEDVESIEFLEPIAASTRYGTLGGLGVVEIYTRGNGPYARQPRALQPESPRNAMDLAITGTGAAAASIVLASMGTCLAGECPFGDFSTDVAATQLAATGLAVPIAVHRAGRRGPLWLEMLASLGIGAAGVAAYDATGSPLALVGTGMLQVAATVLLERR